MVKKLKVLFDSEIIGYGLRENASRSGLFFVAYNVAKYLWKDNRVELCFYCRQGEWRNRIAKYLSQEFNYDLNKRILGEGDDLRSIQYYLSPYPAPPEYVKRFFQITCCTIIHDVTPLLFPQYFMYPIDNSSFMNLIESIDKNNFYFAVSEHTKQDFIKYVPAIDGEKISVIKLAADNRFYLNRDDVAQKNVKEKYHIPSGKKYIFSLCTLEPRKNLIRAVSAFISFVKEHEIEDLIYVLGGGSWETFIGRLEKEVPDFDKYSNRIIQTGYILDEDLPILYSGAEWFVYTSQYEGFGLPPLEAMQCGCPVIVSNNSSLPEVVGDAGIMIDYDSIEQHVQAYETYYYNDEFRRLKSNEGQERARLFSWQNCVNTIVKKLYEIDDSKKNRPLVTVVTATYNLVKNQREKSILQCIESVHEQTYSSIEHIIIDGGSTDGTLELLKKYVDKGWIRLYSEPDRGIYDAMNKGIAKAKGEFVNFLNSDDYFHDKKGIEISVEYLMKNKADYTFADAIILEKSKTTVWKGELSKLILGAHYCHQTMLVKTDVLRNIHGFDLSYSVSADSDLMIRLYAGKYKHTYVPYCFLTYRAGGFSGENMLQSRIDHATSFFCHIGLSMNLTLLDCFLLWQQRFFEEIPLDKQIKLIAKVPLEFGGDYLIDQLRKNRDSFSSKELNNKTQWKWYLCNFIPILSRKNRRNKIYYYLFGILCFMKIVNYAYKRKYYLFRVFPILKIKYK